MLGSEVSTQKEMTFKEAAEAWIKSATTRSRKRMRKTSVPTIESALENYINPIIGDLTLDKVHNGTCKPIVDVMKEKGLASSSMNGYLNIVKSVVKSVIDPETGEPKYNRKWNATYLDLPQVEHKKTPCPTKEQVEHMLSLTRQGSWERRLFLIMASTGMRIGEALALQWSDLLNNGRTISVTKQVDRFGAVVDYTKTKAGGRQVDIHPDVTKVLLEDRPGSGRGLMFPTRNNTVFLPGNIEKRRLRDYVSGSWHQFRRFRESVLSEAGCNHDLRLFWVGHKPQTMDERYSKVCKNLAFRLSESERVGLGFEASEGMGSPKKMKHPRPAAMRKLRERIQRGMVTEVERLRNYKTVD